MSTVTEFEYTPLTRIEMALYGMDYPTDYVAETDNPDVPYEHLYVNLESLADGRLLVARLALLEDIARAGSRAANVDFTPPRSTQLQFSVVLPVKSKHLTGRDRAILVGYLNRLLHMGCFGASAAEGFYFRYTLAAEDADTLNAYLVAEALENVRALCLKYLPVIEDLCAGKHTLHEIIMQIGS